MAFADINLQGVVWRGKGLNFLLLPPGVSAHRLPGAARAQVASQRKSASQREHGKKERRLRAPNQNQKGQSGLQTAQPPDRGPLPQNAWPEEWQKRLAATRPGKIVWTYWELGRDVCLTPNAGRRAFFQRLLTDLGHPAGTHTFWPPCLPADPETSAIPPSPLSETGFTANPDVFWSGVNKLGARGVVAMGEAAVKALNLPVAFDGLQQIHHRGYFVWMLQDVGDFLREAKSYRNILEFLRNALSDIAHSSRVGPNPSR
ncbi:MAG: hypothetical protein LBN28_02830 [Desulfovibrio sp.]|jgi:hypothetical protein|nr:hypothetical protein [Desulfovibrio sp.]